MVLTTSPILTFAAEIEKPTSSIVVCDTYKTKTQYVNIDSADDIELKVKGTFQVAESTGRITQQKGYSFSITNWFSGHKLADDVRVISSRKIDGGRTLEVTIGGSLIHPGNKITTFTKVVEFCFC